MPKKKVTTNKPKHPGGRPTDYTPEKGERICHLIATHPYGLERMCREFEDFPLNRSTIYDWLIDHAEFSNKYMEAKSKQVHRHVEYCIDLSDASIEKMLKSGEISAGEVMAIRLAVDTRKWYASKLAPKIYGDKMLLEQRTDENERLKEELKKYRDKYDKKNKKDY